MPHTWADARPAEGGAVCKQVCRWTWRTPGAENWEQANQGRSGNVMRCSRSFKWAHVACSDEVGATLFL